MAVVLRSATVILLAAGVGYAPAAAQDPAGGETDLLRQAAREESAGDLGAAAATLDRVLARRPGSVPALLSLERVLRIQGRLDALVPAVERALAAEPVSAILNQLRVRTLAGLDRVAELEDAGEAWVAVSGDVEVPYRELAATWESLGDYHRARETLVRGRTSLGRPDALALEMGDLYAELGEPELAAEEWSLAVDDQGRGLSQVRRRVRALPDGGTTVLPGLVERLGSASGSPGRRRAALELAVEAGLAEPVRELTAGLLPALTPEDGRRLLEDVGRRADAAGRARLAYWAYVRLLELEDGARAGRAQGGVGDGRLIAIRSRASELALELGDTAATAGLGVIEAGLDADSPVRRQAAATRVELLALRDPEAADSALAAFRSAYPRSDETDRLTAVVAEALLGAGREGDAVRLLAGTSGPQSQKVRARLALAGGDTEAARTRYLEAAAGLHGAEATGVLELVTVLGRVSRRAGVLLGEAMALVEDGRHGSAIDRVAGAVAGLEPDDGAPLLAFMAAAADDAGLDADARSLRNRVVTEYPHSPEAPEALLALGRSLSDEPASRAEARELLERLIIEYPHSALVPQARRALERIRQGAGA